MASGRRFEIVSRCKNDGIRLPQRGTPHSAGYDFFAPRDVTIPSSLKQMLEIKRNAITGRTELELGKIEPFYIGTGVKAYMGSDEALCLYNRSSSPLRQGLVIPNSVGIIDADYADNPDNEGEISFAFYNLFPYDVEIHKGDKLGQGIFQKYLMADGDEPVNSARTGGFGSTGR